MFLYSMGSPCEHYIGDILLRLRRSSILMSIPCRDRLLVMRDPAMERLPDLVLKQQGQIIVRVEILCHDLGLAATARSPSSVFHKKRSELVADRAHQLLSHHVESPSGEVDRYSCLFRNLLRMRDVPPVLVSLAWEPCQSTTTGNPHSPNLLESLET